MVATDDNIKTLYNLVWGQCTDTMQQKIESLDHFAALQTANDGIGLLLAIKNTTPFPTSHQLQPHTNDALQVRT
jgi:hypothetical protein